MEFGYFRKLNNNEWYSTTKQHLKSIFSDLETLSVLFGLSRKFELDRRCPRKPKVNGIVVASVSYHRDRSIKLYLYPQSKIDYPETAFENFNNEILFDIKQWIESENDKPDTALLGIEKLIVEWYNDQHLFHKVKYL